MIYLVEMITLFFISVQPAVTAQDEIRWSDRQQLTYGDFLGAVPRGTPWAALTSSYVYFTYGTSNGKLSTVKVYASFKTNDSWMKVKNEEVLAHEQLHFAITEIFARKLYKDVDKLRSRTGNISTAASELFQSVNKECEQMQEAYDESTAHGTIPEEQTRWKEKVVSLLKQYDAYPSDGG